MLEILRSELRRLRREESGVALMLTLSVFLLLYVVCAGVYAIGETVRQKIELQNACDSAAYSAAVAQADGLSRMAMINRAMSWTYVKLTNMQIDYITYLWLKLVRKRFDEDSEMCKKNMHIEFKDANEWIKVTLGLVDLSWPEEHPCDHKEIEESLKDDKGEWLNGGGWFCGVAGKGTDCVRLNNEQDDPTSIHEIDEYLKEFEENVKQYEDMIPLLKGAIQTYNYNLLVCVSEMNKSIMQTAAAVLFENLPRKGDGELDSVLGRDFIGYAYHEGSGDPYDDGEVKGYFSPLYNTELGERIFLSMADGEVYDELVDYFGASTDGGKRFGGLDQWFVRSYAGELIADEKIVEQKLNSATENSLRALGICRVFKNTNLDRGLKVYREHHHDFGDKDGQPSCINTHASCPEQCHKVADSVALYADYEWSSGQYECQCTHIHHLEWKKLSFEDIHDVHIHQCSATFKESCDPPPPKKGERGGHQCSIIAGQSHKRSEYFSCVANEKDLNIPFTGFRWIPILPLDCNGNIGWGMSFPALDFGGLDFGSAVLGDLGKKLGLNIGLSDKDWKLTEQIIKLSNSCEPNGFARIYGDDQEIFDEKYYCGEVARPFVLNASFYGKRGAIVVGLARRQRNPWAMLLNELASVVGTNKSDEDGVYSAFNPVDNGYLVAFSASRAAHRFHPSDMALAKANEVGYPIRDIADEGEYETRYDAVCDDDDGGSEKWGDKFGRFTVKNVVEKYRELRVGCVCNDGSPEGKENTARFARCWNLCETDWDATLLPLRFALAEPRGECYDSFGHEVGDNRKIGNVTWQDEGTDDYGYNPLEWASINQGWFSFFTLSGERQHYDESMAETGQFLTLNAPGRVIRGNDEIYDLPYSTEDPNSKLVIPRAVRLKTDGALDLKKAIKIRVL